MNLKAFRLVTLGRLSLEGAAGEDGALTKRRRKLALLALLAVSRRAFPREVLTDTFWGDQDEEHARHSLSDTLSHLRRVLGTRAIAARAPEIGLDRGAPLVVDALELAEAAARGDHARVVELYGGLFLDGVHVDGSPRFEDWVSRERERFQGLFVQSAAALCARHAAQGEYGPWRAVAERWLDCDPGSEAAASNWLEALAAPGTARALEDAISGFELWSARQRRERELDPGPDLRAQVERYRGRLARLPTPAPAPVPLPARRRRRWLLTAGFAAVLVLVVSGALRLSRGGPAEPARPVVAVMALHAPAGDSASAWLQDGLQQMLIADLSRASAMGGGAALDVIDPSLLRDAANRQGAARLSDLTTAQALAMARALGATWVVTGGVTRGSGAYVVDITVRRCSDGSPLQVYSVAGQDILTIADRAAARILSTAETSARGPHLEDIETGNVQAYEHFVRAIQAGQEGRPGDEVRELDLAVLLDSGFVSAIAERLRIASADGDVATERHMAALLRHAGDRLTEWDRLEFDARAAEHDGEHDRAVTLAQELVRRFPRDPRGYEVLANTFINLGRWTAADSVLERLLALDSLATAAGSGPCVPCSAYDGLVTLRITSGDLPGAERAARRWLELQPNLPGPWRDLGIVLAFEGQRQPAIDANTRAAQLSGGDASFTYRLGEILLLSRDYRGVDSLTAGWLRSRVGYLRSDAYDLRAMSEREQGQFRASNATFQRVMKLDRTTADMVLVVANSLARIGERARAAAMYEAIDPQMRPSPTSAVPSLTGDLARAFAWHHALEAEALGGAWAGEPPPTGDTTRLNVLADSVEEIAQRSYYGRDWHLVHHIRGLVAAAGGRWVEAVREFSAARWGAAGFTATDRALAQAYLALGRSDSAIAVLRDGYKGPLDAMGRYEPRTELDYLMAVAFAQAGRRDSAQAYATYVRRAWANADPEVRRRLAALPQ